MRRIACDIVLLPSTEMAEETIRLNRELARQSEHHFLLNATDRLPHLSLAMGCLNEDDLPAASRRLEEIAVRFPPVPLFYTEIHVGTLAGGETVSTLSVGENALLQSLHETVMNRLGPLLNGRAAPEDFIDFPDLQRSSVEWVNGYRENATFDQFSPHITLGFGAPERPARFRPTDTASRLALCHLGNYCTCRKILFEIRLEGKERK